MCVCEKERERERKSSWWRLCVCVCVRACVLLAMVKESAAIEYLFLKGLDKKSLNKKKYS